MKSSEIRQAFIDYFTQKDHVRVDSSPLIPANDPTLLFTNAGMVQFKETFLGLEKRSYSRAVSAQRCVRAGGKHNDLDNVGYTARHHTFFEMLGNFSFGDYFKREAIRFAWVFLTEVLKLPKEKLWVTVYTKDDEAADIWLKEMGVSSERFSRCEEDNFWSMGETGPCGPCTEIFYDHGPQVPGGPPGSPDADGDRYIEIWNLVFMQFNRDKQGQLHPLPRPSVDTGMGLERMAAVMQGVHSNYEIDSFQYLISSIIALKPSVDRNSASLKVIADHIRASAFLIAEGILPSNEGRGYVLRRIIRRAARHGNKLGLESPFFCKLVGPLAEIMGDAYPELFQNQKQIEQVLKQEEGRFAQTLDQGLRLLQEAIKGLKEDIIPGDLAFKLYDTYGFPLDLTEDIARELKLRVDLEGFEFAMQQQREQSQAVSTFSVDYSSDLYLGQQSIFVGYETESLESSISLLVENEEKKEKIKGEVEAVIVLNKTPFYAESGGQVGDKGIIETENALFEVEDTQRVGEAIIHRGNLIKGSFKTGETVKAMVNHQWRSAIRLNHTATHLLHAALKKVLGPEVQQKGSLVHAKRTRFDFSYPEALTKEQLIETEKLVNAKIRHNFRVQTDVMTLEEAKKSGAVALFGEKYAEDVRVLTMGDFSKELCGGTHVSRTGDIGLFKIVAEYGIAAGVRRIDLLTGEEALNFVNQQSLLIEKMATMLKSNTAQVEDKLAQTLAEAKEQEKNLIQVKEKLAAKMGSDLLNAIEVINGINVLIKQIEGSNQDLRTLLDQLRSSLTEGIILLYTIQGDKLQVIAGLSKPLVGKVPSAKELVILLCGKGGGRDDMAQGGGLLPSDLPLRIERVRELLRSAEAFVRITEA